MSFVTQKYNNIYYVLLNLENSSFKLDTLLLDLLLLKI